MKNSKAMILVLLPAYLLLNACGSKAPDPSSLQKSSASSAAGKSADQITSTTNPSTASTTEPVSIADLKAKQNALETEKSNLIAKQGNVQSQKQSFASPAAMTPEALGDFMAVIPDVDQAKIDAIVQAAQDMDFDALQKAIEDLLADFADAIADIQAQLDDLAAQIADLEA